ncbi:MAG: efflux RND transporter periplasmic adaptor subunit, partial [Pseudomonadales bacterium]
EAERLLAEAEGLVRDRFVPESEVKARASAVALAAAALDRARRDADAAREQLARHDLIAPFDGVIARKLTEAGEWVETGTPVLDLVDANHLWLDVRAPQQYWAEFGADAQVTVQVDALAGEAFNARVHARVPVSDPAARTFLVRLVVDAPPEAVTPGMSAQARFRLQGQGSVLRIPRDAIVRYPDGTTTVWAIDRSADGAQARQRAVTLARDLGEQVEIVGGIEAGVPVVVRGNERLREGQAVRIEP